MINSPEEEWICNISRAGYSMPMVILTLQSWTGYISSWRQYEFFTSNDLEEKKVISKIFHKFYTANQKRERETHRKNFWLISMAYRWVPCDFHHSNDLFNHNHEHWSIISSFIWKTKLGSIDIFFSIHPHWSINSSFIWKTKYFFSSHANRSCFFL